MRGVGRRELESRGRVARHPDTVRGKRSKRKARHDVGRRCTHQRDDEEGEDHLVVLGVVSIVLHLVPRAMPRHKGISATTSTHPHQKKGSPLKYVNVNVNELRLYRLLKHYQESRRYTKP